MAVRVRKVWQSNLAEEFGLMERCLKQGFRFVSMDTEFPGTVFTLDIPNHKFSSLSAAQHYALMKANVDALNIIQLGLTLSDAAGNLPNLGLGGPNSPRYVWEFNFRDFDSDYDAYDPKSIALLRSQGVDFAQNSRRGIHSRCFAAYFLKSGLGPGSAGRAWVTFHGLYDLGFLIKILTRMALPDDLGEFMMLVRYYMGKQVYDVKPIARSLALPGGLETVAKSLFLERAAGKSHQAGSDSLLTMQVFMRLVMNRFCTSTMLLQFNYLLYGLTSSAS